MESQNQSLPLSPMDTSEKRLQEEYAVFQSNLTEFPHSFQIIEQGELSKSLLETLRFNLQSDLKAGFKTPLETARGLNLLAFCLFRLNEPAEALAHTERAQSQGGEDKNLVSLANRAVILWRTGRRLEASDCVAWLRGIKEKEEASRFKYLAVKAKAEMAFSYTRLGPRFIPLAIKSFNEVLTQAEEPERSLWKFGLALVVRRSHHLHLAHYFPDQPRTSVALSLFLDVIKTAESKNLRANAYAEIALLLNSDRQDKSLSRAAGLTPMQACLKALELDDNEFSVLTKSGKIFRYKKKRDLLDKSRELLTKSLELRPCSNAYHHLGLTYKALANSERYTSRSSGHDRENPRGGRRPRNRGGRGGFDQRRNFSRGYRRPDSRRGWCHADRLIYSNSFENNNASLFSYRPEGTDELLDLETSMAQMTLGRLQQCPHSLQDNTQVFPLPVSEPHVDSPFVHGMINSETPQSYHSPVVFDTISRETPQYYHPPYVCDMINPETPQCYHPPYVGDMINRETPQYYHPPYVRDTINRETPQYYHPPYVRDTINRETSQYYHPPYVRDTINRETPQYFHLPYVRDTINPETPQYYHPPCVRDTINPETPLYYHPPSVRDTISPETYWLRKSVKSPPSNSTKFSWTDRFVQETMDSFQKAIESSHGINLPALYDLALMFKALDEPHKALEHLQKIMIAKTFPDGAVQKINAYEQSGLILREMSEKETDAEKRTKWREEGESMLNMALSLASQVFSNVPRFQEHIGEVWHSFSTLFRAVEQSNSSIPNKLSKKAQLLQLIKKYKESMDLLQKIAQMSKGQENDPHYLKMCIENHVGMNQFAEAVTFVDLLKCTLMKEKVMKLFPEEFYVQKIYIRAGKQSLLRGPSGLSIAREEFRSVFVDAFESTHRETSSPEDTESMDEDFDNEEDTWHVMFIYEPKDQDIKGKTHRIARCLHNNCGLRSTCLDDDVTPGTFIQEGVIKAMDKSLLVIIMIGLCKLSRTFKLYINHAVRRASTVTVKDGSSCHIPAIINREKLLDFPQELLNFEAENVHLSSEGEVDALCSFFSFLIGVRMS